MKNANIVQTCPKCFAFVANLKKHRKWHRRTGRTGPMGPVGPQGPMGSPGVVTSSSYTPASPELSFHLDGYSWNAKESKEDFMRRYEEDE
jgi:hypothetical protein